MNPTKEQCDRAIDDLRTEILSLKDGRPANPATLQLLSFFLEKVRGHLPSMTALVADRQRRAAKKGEPEPRP